MKVNFGIESTKKYFVFMRLKMPKFTYLKVFYVHEVKEQNAISAISINESEFWH